MALGDVISQLGTTIINLVSNTVQGIADYLNNNSGNIPDTGGGTTGTITIPDPLTVNQLNTSAILGNVSFTTGEQVTPGQGEIFLLGKVIGFGAGDLYLYHDISQFCVFATDYFNTGGSVSATLNSMIFKNKNALDNPTDSGLYVNDSAVLTNATLPNTEFSTLNTTDKTIIGAINELKARLDNLGI